MRQVNRALLSATVLLAMTLAAGAPSAAFAPSDEAVDLEAFEDDEEVLEDDAPGVFEEAEAPTEVAGEETAEEITEAQPDEGAPASDGPVLAVPGSTDESAPGGSTRPGTTPDD